MNTKLLVASALLLLTSVSFSAPRLYRVIENTGTESGYALAWGFASQVVDFERIEEQGNQVADDFLYNNYDSIRNYLVHVPTDTIVETFGYETGGKDSEPFVVGHFNGNPLGNHFYLSITQVPATGLEWNQSLLIETSGQKWSGGINSAKVVQKDIRAKIVNENRTIEKDIIKQIYAKLTKSQKERLDEMAVHSYVNVVKDSRGLTKTQFLMSGAVPKDGDSMEVTSDLSFSVKNGVISALVSNVKVQ
jgi:hypothetical protein